jgi:long-chain acyl-CoA synthetase
VRLIENEVAEKNKGLASFESVKKFKIVPEFTIANGLLTPTLKIKKNLVAEKYKMDIEAMYAGDGVLFNNFVSQPAETVMERIAA